MLFASDFSGLAYAALFWCGLLFFLVVLAVSSVIALVLRRWWPLALAPVLTALAAAILFAYGSYADARQRQNQAEEAARYRAAENQPTADDATGTAPAGQAANKDSEP